MRQLGYLRAVDDEETLLAWERPADQTLLSYIRHTKDITSGTEFLKKAYQFAHERDVVIDGDHRVANTILVNPVTGAYHFGELQFAVALLDNNFSKDELKEKTKKE
jgi:hypothetical protein